MFKGLPRQRTECTVACAAYGTWRVRSHTRSGIWRAATSVLRDEHCSRTYGAIRVPSDEVKLLPAKQWAPCKSERQKFFVWRGIGRAQNCPKSQY